MCISVKYTRAAWEEDFVGIFLFFFIRTYYQNYQTSNRNRSLVLRGLVYAWDQALTL